MLFGIVMTFKRYVLSPNPSLKEKKMQKVHRFAAAQKRLRHISKNARCSIIGVGKKGSSLICKFSIQIWRSFLILANLKTANSSNF